MNFETRGRKDEKRKRWGKGRLQIPILFTTGNRYNSYM